MLRATIVALILVTATSSWAAGTRLAVVDLATPPNMMGLGGQLTQLVLKSAQQQGYQVVPPDRIRRTLEEKAYLQLQDCGGEPACVANKLAEVPAQRAVVGSLDRDEKAYLLRLFLIDLEKREVISTVERSILIASRRLIPDATEAIPPLLKGQREAKGTLTVSTNVPDVFVTLDGEPAGIAPVTVQLKPGKHTVKLEKRQYLPMERLVTVEANQTTAEEFRLLLAPGERLPDALEPKVASRAAAAPEPGALRIPALGWAAYAGALGAGAGAIYFGTQARQIEARLKDSYLPDSDLYMRPRTLALEGQRDALVANVLFGVAGAALGTAVTLTIIESNQPPPPVQVTPAPTPGGAALLLNGRF